MSYTPRPRRNPVLQAQELDLSSDHSGSIYSSDDDQGDQDLSPPSQSILQNSFDNYQPLTLPTIPVMAKPYSSSSSEKGVIESNRADGALILTRNPHKSFYFQEPVTNNLIRQEFAEISYFSHFERDDGQIIKVEKKPDYQYALEAGHSYTLIPRLPSSAASPWFIRLYDSTLGKILTLTMGDLFLVLAFGIVQVLVLLYQHKLLTVLHTAFPQPPKSPYFEYRQPRWKYECSQRVEFIVKFVAQQPTAFLAILFFARRRLRLEVTRAILLVGFHTFILHAIVVYLALDVLDHKINMDWMSYILNWYTSIIYFGGVAALGLRR